MSRHKGHEKYGRGDVEGRGGHREGDYQKEHRHSERDSHGRRRESDRTDRRSERRDLYKRPHQSRRGVSESDEEGGVEKSEPRRPNWENPKVRKHAEHIQQRKMLWTKEKKEELGEEKPTAGSSSATPSCGSSGGKDGKAEAWKSMIAASSSDTEQMNKFQRLMGMKKNNEPGGGPPTNVDVAPSQGEDERRRQREMKERLDQQYAAARAATHGGRGRGLGFQ